MLGCRYETLVEMRDGTTNAQNMRRECCEIALSGSSRVATTVISDVCQPTVNEESMLSGRLEMERP